MKTLLPLLTLSLSIAAKAFAFSDGVAMRDMNCHNHFDKAVFVECNLDELKEQIIQNLLFKALYADVLSRLLPMATETMNDVVIVNKPTPTDKKVCTLFMQGPAFNSPAAYSCDVEKPILIDIVSDLGSATPEVSGQILKYVEAGYEVLNCQYMTAVDVRSQYICNFLESK